MKVDVEKFRKACSCGQVHEMKIEKIILEEEALKQLPQVCDEKGLNHLVMICDENTYEVAGKKVEKLLPSSKKIVLKGNHIHADEESVDIVSTFLSIQDNVDAVVAVGSGTIHDITRYCIRDTNIKFISVPTAASVDGYTSTVAAMTLKGFKKTVPACAPDIMVIDSRILAKAPLRLTASGVGDLLGKYTALADWRISHILTGEYLCEEVFGLEQEALNRLCESLHGLKTGQIKAYEELMYGLSLSGIAIQMIGNSRPASGTEHHMSHLWEMEIINPYLDYLHGEKVGVGLVISSRIYHQAADIIEKGEYKLKDKVLLEKKLIKDTYGTRGLESTILKENIPNLLENITPGLLRKHGEDIVKAIRAIPIPETLIGYLKEVEGVFDIKELGLDGEMTSNTVRISPYIRKRLTFMRLLKFYDFYEEIIET